MTVKYVTHPELRRQKLPAKPRQHQGFAAEDLHSKSSLLTKVIEAHWSNSNRSKLGKISKGTSELKRRFIILLKKGSEQSRELKQLSEKLDRLTLAVERGRVLPTSVHAKATRQPQDSNAQVALLQLRDRLAKDDGKTLPKYSSGPVSETIKSDWIANGVLVGSTALRNAWGGRTRQSLDQARNRGELVGLKISGRLWYPSAFLSLPADFVKTICGIQLRVDPVTQVIFWTRKHGALGGMTIAQAFVSNQIQRAIQLAEAFARDYTGADAPA